MTPEDAGLWRDAALRAIATGEPQEVPGGILRPVPRCYSCPRPVRFYVGGSNASWPVCWRHLGHVLRVARRWRRSGLNSRTWVHSARRWWR